MKIGLFGGSFNPLHNGHIDMARRVRAAFGLDRILLMVAKDPPHKIIACDVDAAARFALAEAGLAGEEGIFASDMELSRPGKSYTVDTVRALLRDPMYERISLIVGEDMLQSLPTWREAEALLSLVDVIAVGRPGVAGDVEAAAELLRARYGARVRVAAFEGEDVSSTEVRRRVREALPIEGLVPPGVERGIYVDALYQEEAIAGMQHKLRDSLDGKRYLHSVGAMRTAISLCARYGADAKRARLAALLHDCAKLPHERLLSLAAQYGLALDEWERADPGLLHPRIGALLARDVYGITDEAVLAAIACHQTARPNMTLLERIVYLADKLEPSRGYDGIEELRALSREDLDCAMLAFLKREHARMAKRGRAIKPEGIAAREWLEQELTQRQKPKQSQQTEVLN